MNRRIRIMSIVSAIAGLVSLACSHEAEDCHVTQTCGSSGAGTCTPACTSAKPYCDTTNKCVQCRTSTDCASAAASLCSNGTCTGCTDNTDCSHISGKNVCTTASTGDAGAPSGTCVQCTGSDYAVCGHSDAGKSLVCNSLTNLCSSVAEQSAGLCQTCVSDAQCAAGELCAEQIFNGKTAGHYCFYEKGNTANGAPALCSSARPYVQTSSTTTIDGEPATLCTLRATTCTALNQFSQLDCTTSGAANDQLCGFAPGADSKCALFDTGIYRCTVTCLSDDDCKTGVACNTAVNPNVCNLQ